jgi:hypothetical protein
MKKIFILIITIFAAQSSFSFEALDVVGIDYVSFEVTDVVRDSVNDANLRISGVQIENNYDGNNSHNVDLILRDKFNIIEPFIEEGFTIRFQAPFIESILDNTTHTYYVDESNPSDITITDNFHKKIAYTRNFSSLKKGQSIPITIENTNMIISRGEIIDCMEGTNKKVCHPEINIETIEDIKVLKRGDFLLRDIINIDKLYLSDTHIYKQHNRDNQDYLRVQFLIETSDVQKKVRYANDFYLKQSLFDNPYCKVQFSESGEVVRSCGIRGWIYNLNKYITAKITPESDYGMIAC